jgi:hypothetical protein
MVADVRACQSWCVQPDPSSVQMVVLLIYNRSTFYNCTVHTIWFGCQSGGTHSQMILQRLQLIIAPCWQVQYQKVCAWQQPLSSLPHAACDGWWDSVYQLLTWSQLGPFTMFATWSVQSCPLDPCYIYCLAWCLLLPLLPGAVQSLHISHVLQMRVYLGVL